ncbi:MAG: hypothetical protein SF029_09480 [bacterium]|nr:hypothetical protein [bacterium]
MDKAITTALLIVISMILAVMLFNVAYPAVVEGGDAITSMAGRTQDQMRTQIRLIHATGELDSAGWWQDTNGNGQFDVLLWVKNIGDSRITAVDQLDVFFGPEGNFARIPHESAANGSLPSWTWTVENAAEWTPTATLRITIRFSLPLTSGRYFAKVVTPSGVEDETFMGL